ncbi:MAG: hypothetical protein Q9182_003277 [Xanthomendoza sp. 2 TL-2023]
MISGYPVASSKTDLPSAPPPKPYGTGLGPGSRQSYPLYYNTSSTSGPTASFGTVVSSGLPWNNHSLFQETAASASDPDSAINCPPVSTLTIQNTITVPPVTVTAPPVTITVTSTVPASPEISPQSTPTVTITILATVYASAGPNTNLGGSGSTTRTSSGGEQIIGELPSKSGNFEFSIPAESGSDSVLVPPLVTPSLVASESYPETSGSASVIQPYKPMYANNTGDARPTVPEVTGYNQPTGTPESSISSVEQPYYTSVPGTGSSELLVSSEISDSGQEATTLPAMPTSIPITPVYGPYDNTSSKSGFTTESNILATNPVTTSLISSISDFRLSYGQGTHENSTPVPYITSSDGPSTANSAGYGSAGTGIPNTSRLSNVGPHDVPPFANSTVSLPSSSVLGTGIPYQPYPNTVPASQNPVSPPPATTTISKIPPYSNSTSPLPSPPILGTGLPDQPLPDTAAFLQGSGSLLPMTTPFPPYQASSGTISSKAQEILTTTSGTLLVNETSSGTGTIYITSTQKVVPYPVGSSKNISFTQGTSSRTVYGYNPPMATGIMAVTGHVEGENGGSCTSTSATTSNNGPIPSDAPPQTPNHEMSTSNMSTSATSSDPIPTIVPSSDPFNANTTRPNPSCIPSSENLAIKADFNGEPAGVPLPTPYQHLTFTGFEINTGSPSPHLSAPNPTAMKSISIAPPAQHFNLTSIALACSRPPCNITMWGTKVAATTAQGAAAGTLLTFVTRVEGAAEGGMSEFRVVDGLVEKGWVDLERVGFAAKGDGGEGLGIGVDELGFMVRVVKGCQGDEVGGEGGMEERR